VSAENGSFITFCRVCWIVCAVAAKRDEERKGWADDVV